MTIPGRPLLAGLLLLALVAPASAAATATSSSPRAEDDAPRAAQPLFAQLAVADPSVAHTRRGRVLVSTGPRVRRVRWLAGSGWRETRDALGRLPAWARDGHVWAPDIAWIKGRWVLYYAAPVAGIVEESRCLGVATAARPFGVFRPVDRRPLACPRRAATPPAADLMPGSGGLPKLGVIDPSFFVDTDGRPYLLYKTDGIPSSIRLLPLNPRGLGPAPGATSIELLRSRGVIENPVLVKKQGRYHLFTSHGDWSRCVYREVVRSSVDLTTWREARPRVLLSTARSGGLCGPGGADLLDDDGRIRMFFHAWVERGTTAPIVPPFWAGHHGPAGTRVLYGAVLSFTDSRPRVTRYLGR